MKRAQPQTGLSPLLKASIAVAALSLPVSLPAAAQRMDLAVTYTAQRSLKANTGQNFWMQGGSAEFGIDLWHGWGLAADLTGTHTDSIGSSGVPLLLVTETFGPRYRWRSRRKISFYGQGLVGAANGLQSLFPSPGGATSSAKSFALQLGGGVDYRLTSRFGARIIDAGWLRTQLPNGGNSVQNSMRLGAGVTLCF